MSVLILTDSAKRSFRECQLTDDQRSGLTTEDDGDDEDDCG